LRVEQGLLKLLDEKPFAAGVIEGAIEDFVAGGGEHDGFYVHLKTALDFLGHKRGLASGQ